MKSTTSKTSLLIIFLTVFIDLLGFGIVLPLLPIYAKDFARENAIDNSGWVIGALMAIFSVMQFLFAPLWGRLSDRIGRRPVLMIGLSGSVVFYTLFGVATEMKDLTLLFVSRIGAGIAGATISTAQAYIADSTSLEDRPKGMALIGMAFGLGFTFGPLIGFLAVPSGQGDPGPLPGYVAAGLSLVALLLAIFKLPESRQFDRPSEFRRQFIDFAALRKALATPSIAMLLLAIFVLVFSFANFEVTLSLLIKDKKAAVLIDLVANDWDHDDGLDLGSVTIVNSPAHGSLILHRDGKVTYTHDGGETTADSFSYTINDASGASSNPATVTITVKPVDNPPTGNVADRAASEPVTMAVKPVNDPPIAADDAVVINVGDIASPFGFSWGEVCLTYAYIGITLAIIQGVVVRRIAGRISEGILASSGALVEIVGFLVVLQAIQQKSTPLLMGALAVIVTGFAFMQPSLNSLLSRRSDPARQGGIFGVSQSVNSMARIFGSFIGIPLYDIDAAIPYYLAVGLMGLGFVLVVFAARGGADFAEPDQTSTGVSEGLVE